MLPTLVGNGPNAGSSDIAIAFFQFLSPLIGTGFVVQIVLAAAVAVVAAAAAVVVVAAAAAAAAAFVVVMVVAVAAVVAAVETETAVVGIVVVYEVARGLREEGGERSD